MSNLFSKNAPALLLAAAMLVGSAITVAAPRLPGAVGGPLVLVLGLLGADVLQRRRAGLGSRPASSTLLLAASLLVACGILTATDTDGLLPMFPILGGAAAASLLRPSRACSWRRQA
jgi:hypothetical protein